MLVRIEDRERIPERWPGCVPLFRRAFARSVGHLTPDAILAGLAASSLDLWMDEDRSSPIAIVTGVNCYAEARVLSIVLLGGTDIAGALPEIETALARYAVSQDCTALEAYVRPGMIGASYRQDRALLQGWRTHWTLVRKDVSFLDSHE